MHIGGRRDATSDATTQGLVGGAVLIRGAVREMEAMLLGEPREGYASSDGRSSNAGNYHKGDRGNVAGTQSEIRRVGERAAT